MTTDRELLMWIHERLEKQLGVSDIVGYMHRLRGIIAALPAAQASPSTCTNSLEELQRKLPRMDALKKESWLTRWARHHIEYVEERYSQLSHGKGTSQ